MQRSAKLLDPYGRLFERLNQLSDPPMCRGSGWVTTSQISLRWLVRSSRPTLPLFFLNHSVYYVTAERTEKLEAGGAQHCRGNSNGQCNSSGLRLSISCRAVLISRASALIARGVPGNNGAQTLATPSRTKSCTFANRESRNSIFFSLYSRRRASSIRHRNRTTLGTRNHEYQAPYA